VDGRKESNVEPPELFKLEQLKPRKRKEPQEYQIVALRECPVPDQMRICDTPEQADAYWRLNIQTIPYYNPDCECFAILLLNTRRRVKGHHLVSIGTLDSVLVHPREVFRIAIMMGGISAIILAHNHPSGDPSPSDADIKITRDLIRAGQLLKIEVLDHIIVGAKTHSSLRSMGFFY
jgi:DNA repair protein RadC